MKCLVERFMGFSPMQVDEDTYEIVYHNTWDYFCIADSGDARVLQSDSYLKVGSFVDSPDSLWEQDYV